jgi:hypothetical protein
MLLCYAHALGEALAEQPAAAAGAPEVDTGVVEPEAPYADSASGSPVAPEAEEQDQPEAVCEAVTASICCISNCTVQCCAWCARGKCLSRLHH